jgi:hypothetical protein
MKKRDTYASSPRWIVLGDQIIIIVAALILFGGTLTNGYVDSPDARTWAWMACAVLGLWGILGWVAGRWDGPEKRSLRILATLFIMVTAICGIQLIPLPTSLVTALQPEWRHSIETLRSVGMEVPASIPMAHVPERALRSWDQMVASLLFFLGVAMPASRGRSGLQLLWVVAGFSVFEGLAAMTAIGVSSRVSGTIYNPNHSAAAILLGLPVYSMLVYDSWRERAVGYTPLTSDWRTMLMLLVGAGALIGWLSTLSRGSLMMGGAVLAFWALYEVRGTMKRERNQSRRSSHSNDGPMVLVAVVLILIVCAVVVFEALFARLSELEAGSSSRIDSWRATLIGLQNSNFLGLGLGGAEFAMKRFETTSGATATVWSHNDWVQIVAEVGIVGIVVIAVLGFLLAQSLTADWRRRSLYSWDRRRICRAAWAGCAALVLHALVEFHLRIPTVGLAFLAMLATALQAPDWPRAGGKSAAGEWESDDVE